MDEIMIDLIVEQFGIRNPCLIAEEIEKIFQVEVNILAIESYLEPDEDFEKESRKEYYTQYH